MAGKRVIIDTSGELAEITNSDGILMLVETLAADPVTALVEGRIYWNSASKKFRRYNGVSWGLLGPSFSDIWAANTLMTC